MDITNLVEICDRFSPSIWVVLDIEMRALSYDVFFESNGIFKAIISDLFNCDDFLFQRRGLFLSFFRGCMLIPESCTDVIMLLLSLTCAYAELYETHVSKPIGNIEKQMKLGKIMIRNLEAKRDLLIDDYMVKFTGLTCIYKFIKLELIGEVDENDWEESNSLFVFIEKFLYNNFWIWLHREKRIHVNNFIKERPNDVNYPFSPVMQDKIYDITMTSVVIVFPIY